MEYGAELCSPKCMTASGSKDLKASARKSKLETYTATRSSCLLENFFHLFILFWIETMAVRDRSQASRKTTCGQGYQQGQLGILYLRDAKLSPVHSNHPILQPLLSYHLPPSSMAGDVVFTSFSFIAIALGENFAIFLLLHCLLNKDKDKNLLHPNKASCFQNEIELCPLLKEIALAGI